MKFTTWCVGWLVLGLWINVAGALQSRMWPVLVAAILWALLGGGIGLAFVVRLSLGKLGAGVRGLPRVTPTSTPAPQQKPPEVKL